MIGPREIREWLRAEPVRPFVIFVSDGGAYVVSHPELASVTLTGLWIFFPESEPFENGNYAAAKLSYLHISRLEHVRRPTIQSPRGSDS